MSLTKTKLKNGGWVKKQKQDFVVEVERKNIFHDTDALYDVLPDSVARKLFKASRSNDRVGWILKRGERRGFDFNKKRFVGALDFIITIVPEMADHKNAIIG